MSARNALKNDFIFTLALGIFLSFMPYFWFSKLDFSKSLHINVSSNYNNFIDPTLRFLVLLGTFLIYISICIETYRVKHKKLIFPLIVSIFQVLLAFKEVLDYFSPISARQNDLYLLLKWGLDFLEIWSIGNYLAKFGGNHRIGKILIKTVKITTLIPPIMIPLLLFFNINIFILFISSDMGFLKLLLSCLFSSLFPISVLFFKEILTKPTKPSPDEEKNELAYYCQECGKQNELKARFCVECGVEIVKS